jgi:hypothetical protein
MFDYLVEISCREDHIPVQSHLRELGYRFSDAPEGWIEGAVSHRQADALYLQVTTNNTRDQLATDVAVNGWVALVKAERDAVGYPA